MSSRLPFLSLPFNAILLFNVLSGFRATTAQEANTAKLSGPLQVRCGESTIWVTLTTNEPFEGNVYAKGFFEDENCKVQGNSSGNTVNITIPINSNCGMRRRRIINPKGIALEMTMVLMLHPKFLTRNDQTFNIKCIYLETSQRFTNRLEVSMSSSASKDMTSTDGVTIESEARLPKCRYEVLNEERRTMVFATIGQPVVHRWSCTRAEEEDTDDLSRSYCLTVHSCLVDDGHGNEQKLLDFNGCSLDKTLMDEIHYETDLEATRKSFVFKFADKPTIYFSCQLRLEPKSDFDSQCPRTVCPPTAPKTSTDTLSRTFGHKLDFPEPRADVTPAEDLAANPYIKSHGVNWLPEIENKKFGLIARPNDSLKSFPQARPVADLKALNFDYNEGVSGDEDEETKFHLDQIPLSMSPSSTTVSNASSLTPGFQTSKSFVSELSETVTQPLKIAITKGSMEESELSTVVGSFGQKATKTIGPPATNLTDSSELDELEMRLQKLEYLEGRQKTVEIDVNTPLSVLDLPPVSPDLDELLLEKVTSQRNLLDITSESKICVSRQVLSALVLVMAVLFLLMSLVFGIALWRFVKRPRVIVMQRREPFGEPHAERRVLSAFHA